MIRFKCVSRSSGQPFLAAPLGQGPLAFDGIGIGGPNLFVFFFLGPAFEHLLDLRGGQRDLPLAGHFYDVLFSRIFLAIQQFARNAPAVGQHEYFGPAGKTRVQHEHQY